MVRRILAENDYFTDPQGEDQEREEAQRKRRKMINVRNREIFDMLEGLGMMAEVDEIGMDMSNRGDVSFQGE